MNMITTQKTYYGLCVVSAAIEIIKALLNIMGMQVNFFAEAAIVLFCVGMLFLIGCYKGDKLHFVTLTLAAILATLGLAVAALPFVALSWPCFAFAYRKDENNNIKIMAMLTITAGVLKAVVFFLAGVLGIYYDIICVAAPVCAMIFALCLFRRQAQKKEIGEVDAKD